MEGGREGQGELGLRSEEEIGGGLGLLSEEEVEQRQSSGLQVFIEARYTKRRHSPGVNKAPVGQICTPRDTSKQSEAPHISASSSAVQLVAGERVESCSRTDSSALNLEADLEIKNVKYHNWLGGENFLNTDHISCLEVDQRCGSAL